jgi:hypothetical protein
MRKRRDNVFGLQFYFHRTICGEVDYGNLEYKYEDTSHHMNRKLPILNYQGQGEMEYVHSTVLC